MDISKILNNARQATIMPTEQKMFIINGEYYIDAIRMRSKKKKEEREKIDRQCTNGTLYLKR